MIQLKILFAIIGSACILWADPISPDSWNVRDDQGTGAVILNEVVEIDNDNITRFIQIRILSEKGRSAVSKFKLSRFAENIDGRTILSDGTVIPIQPQKDVVEKRIGEGGYANIVELIPPATTTDCIVELSWSSPTRFDLVHYNNVFNNGFIFKLNIGRAFPVNKMELKLNKYLAVSANMVPFEAKPEKRDVGSMHLFTFRNLPAFEDVPYALDSARHQPYLELFSNPDRDLDLDAHLSVEKFWDLTVKESLIPRHLDRLSIGKSFEGMSREIRQNLSGAPFEQATEIMLRLKQRIVNLDQQTDQEKQVDNHKTKRDAYLFRDLEGMAKRGNGHRWSIFLAFMRILEDARIPYKVGFGSNRNHYQFNPQRRNANIIEEEVLLVDGPDGSPLFLDPSARFSSPGLLPVEMQGSQGLLVDMKQKTWKFITFPIQSALFNRRIYTYHLELGEDSTQIHLEGTFSGAVDQEEKRRLIGLDAMDQQRSVRERLESYNRGASIQRVEVVHAQDTRANLVIKADATVSDEGEHVKTINPFPLMSIPFHLPTTWPENRSERIVLPYALTHLATCTFSLPIGAKLAPVHNMLNENSFGRVAWGVEEKNREVKVVIRIDLKEPMAPPSHYEELRKFMAWVEDAYSQRLVIGKGRS